MKIQVDREILLTSLNNVGRAISTKPQMPILTGIKLEADKYGLTLTASNSDISIQTNIAPGELISIEEEGTVVLPGKYFCDIVKKCDSKYIYISSFEENSVKIIANQSNFTLNLLDKSIFPYISFDFTQDYLCIDAINLKQIIKKTAFAASLDEAKMVLTGVSFAVEDNKIEAIATDSFRLAKKYITFEEKVSNIKVIIPSKALDELSKVIEDVQEMVQIHFTPTRALFKYKNILFQTRLIEGKFPKTTSLIPTDYITSIKFNKTELISSIDRASLLNTNEINNIIKFNLNEDKEVVISSYSSEIGGTLEKIIPLECSQYVNFETAFSAKYFLEALRAFDSNDITIHFTSEIKPFVITSDYDINHIQLILPVRI